MKFFKKVAIAAMTLSLALSTCALASCTDGKDSSSTAASVCYTFIVINANGTAAHNVSVMLCKMDDSALCFGIQPINAEGKCEYTAAPEAGVYAIHIVNQGGDYTIGEDGYVAFDGPTTTPAEYGEITLTLK